MRKIMVALSEEGHFVMSTNAGTFYNSVGDRVRIGFPGLSDLVGCTSEGRFFAIEVKLPGEHPREDQRKFLNAMRRTGAIAGCAHSVEEALTIIREDEDIASTM
jgi:hypothetical protein